MGNSRGQTEQAQVTAFEISSRTTKHDRLFTHRTRTIVNTTRWNAEQRGTGRTKRTKRAASNSSRRRRDPEHQRRRTRVTSPQDNPKTKPRQKRSGLFGTASSRPCRQRRLRRRLGGRSGPSAPFRNVAFRHGRIRALEFISFGPPCRSRTRSARDAGMFQRPSVGFQAGRARASGQLHCENVAGASAAALKGPLRRPPAALDRCSFQGCDRDP